MMRPFLLLAMASVALSAAGTCSAAGGQLSARPSASVAALQFRQGDISSVAGKGALYVPRRWDGRRALPLLLVLPGTGGDGRQFMASLRPFAEEGGFAMLAFSPGSGNFKTVDNFFDDRESGVASANVDWPKPRWGSEVAQIDRALAEVFGGLPVDPARVGLLGFSHGASYALMLGTANPTLFSTIEAFSPFILVTNDPLAGGQSVFLSHGTEDREGTFRRTSCAMVFRLRQFGNRVEFRPFKGGHTIDPAHLNYGLNHFLRGRVAPSADERSGKLALPANCAKR